MPAADTASVAGDVVNDPIRLEALRNLAILDTEPEPEFDDAVRLATRLCDTPVALVSLVASDRQWFKARVGFPRCETDLDSSVCAHALSEPDLLVIPDLTLDARTDRNPLVVGEPGIRFYAGAPLRLPDGQVVGSLCVIDTVARPTGLTEAQAEDLRALGRQVSATLSVREVLRARERLVTDQRFVSRQKEEVLQLTEKLQLAVEATRIGIFDYDLVSGELIWDARVRELFGLSQDAPVTYEGSYLAGVHPEDREFADQAVQQALDPSGPGVFDIEYRVVPVDGSRERWLAARGQSVIKDGQTIRFVGSVHDVTDRRAAEEDLRDTAERYHLAARATNDAIWDWKIESNHVLWNEALTTAYGYPIDTVEPSGDWWIEHIHPDDRERIQQSIHEVIDGTGSSWHGSYRFLRAAGSYAYVVDRGFVIRDERGQALRMIGAMLDDTQRIAMLEEQALLNQEMSHRLKNTLAMVMSIATQTLRSVEDRGPVIAFEKRIHALSSAHDILLQQSWNAAPLEHVARNVLNNIAQSDRFIMIGPSVVLGPRATLSLSLILHELGTNALKYGALSNDVGAVTLEWAIDGDQDDGHLRLVWREENGPTVTAPARKGFGSRLVRMGLVGSGEVHLSYDPAGFVAEMAAPLVQLRLS